MNYFVIPGIEFDASQVRTDLIIRTVCEYYEKETGLRITTKDIKSKIRKQNVVDARSISAYLLESAYGLGCTKIGRIINRDHASVLHYWGRTRDYMEYDHLTKSVVEKAKSSLTPYNINWKPVRFGAMKMK